MKAAREPWGAPALLSRSVSLAPRDPVYALAWGEAYRRLAADDPRLLSRAEEAYRHGLAEQPPSPDLMIALAQTQSARNDTRGAEATYRSLLARDPLQPAALLGLARILVTTGRPGDALPLLERRAQYAVRDPQGWYALGQAREATGSVDAARAAYEKVARLAPGDQEAQAALRRLGR
jgi:predicted Zn-dependent protease